MTFEDYLDKAAVYQVGNPQLRAGQALVNYLCEVRPDLYRRIYYEFAYADPFYQNSKVEPFLTKLQVIWHEPKILP